MIFCGKTKPSEPENVLPVSSCRGNAISMLQGTSVLAENAVGSSQWQVVGGFPKRPGRTFVAAFGRRFKKWAPFFRSARGRSEGTVSPWKNITQRFGMFRVRRASRVLLSVRRRGIRSRKGIPLVLRV